MYFPLGWPRLLRIPGHTAAAAASPGEDVELKQVVCNRDKILTAILTANSIQIWYVKPCVPIISHRRTHTSLEELGENVAVQWRPDSSMICVVTSLGHLIIYHIVVPTEVKTLYEQVDAPSTGMKRESDELFMKELIPPLIFSMAFEVEIEGGISDIVAIREELMIATKSGRILRFAWDGQEIRDYSLDLRRIPFCIDQQVLKAVPLADKGAYVTNIAYSPLLGGYTIILNDGRAAFLVASNMNFDPNSVTGIWAPQIDDATCIALNHKFKLIALGTKSSHGMVYNIDEMTGGLAVTHRLILRTRDYPGYPGAVTCMKWTPDGTALAMTWSLGGFSLWSTFGTMIMCSLCWDYGPSVSDPVSQNPLCLASIDWTAEGYQLWMINAKTRGVKEEDKEFMPYPSDYESAKDQRNEANNPLANKAMVLQFVKSPISVNPGMSKQEHIYLQGEDKLFLNLGQTREFSQTPLTQNASDSSECKVFTNGNYPKGNISLSLISSGSKHWTTISIPHTYIGSSWPIRYTALDESCEYLAVAGRTGLAHYSIGLRKWRLFGNETQEKDFIVTGGLLWWKEFIIVGCFNLAALVDEVRIYSRAEKLDNAHAKMFKVDTQVLLLNLLKNQLVVFCADNQISIYNLTGSSDGKASSLSCSKMRTFDANSIPGLIFHPACVVLVALTNLKTETSRSGNRDSLSRESPTQQAPLAPTSSNPSIILNICGRVIMIQVEERIRGEDGGRTSPQMTLPTVLASNCEIIWFPRHTNKEKPHLTASLWLYCGIHGMRVWLPVFPREGDHAHTFMSKRIMLHFPMYKLYPLAILFEDAIILGTENDTMFLKSTGMIATNVPYSTLERTSLLFLHPILRQLIRRNLGYHAWEIARTCMTLPYFQHSLELLLHEVLEEEATSTEPIPDALLPSVVEFIQEFPVFHKTIGRCARKTEVALWPHLFAVVGSPGALFVECLGMRDLETAASYLLILENLEPPNVAMKHATLLLDAALDSGSWELAQELVRFLRTIDPSELEEASHRPIPTAAHYGMSPQSPPISKSAAPEEEISLLLGTLQVPRGRSTSITQAMRNTSPKESSQHKDLVRSQSEMKPGLIRTRKASSSSLKDSAGSPNMSAEELFIDTILQRHARKLLSQSRLLDLGTFAAHLDFHMVTWLKKETSRAARVDNSVTTLKKLHADFSWPYPVLLTSIVSDLKRKQSQESMASISTRIPPNNASQDHAGISAATMDDKFKALKLDLDYGRSVNSGHNAITDSGYLSQSAMNGDHQLVAGASRSSAGGGGGYANGSSTASTVTENHGLLSEQTIHAMLKPHSFREDVSIISDDGASVTSPEDLPSPSWSGLHSRADYSAHQDHASKGPQKAEIQLRYLLQLMLEASCLEMASVICILLKDALALIRIVNAARTAADKQICVSRLFKCLKEMEVWAKSECPGYVPFFQAIQPQINSLKAFLMENSSDTARTARYSTSSLSGANQALQTADTASAGSPHVHRTTSVGTGIGKRLLNNPVPKPRLMAKQRSLPSDIVGTEVGNLNLDAPSEVHSAKTLHSPTEPREDAAARTRALQPQDASSVSPDVLPEGQEEQPGCVVS